jgi:hypothetical protein
MRREIKHEKQIKINGQLIFARQVARWQCDNASDNPFASELNESRWKTFLSVKKGWDALDAEQFLPFLNIDFEYGSYWVKEPMRGVAAYRKYITGKFETIGKTKSAPSVSIVILREGISPIGYSYALLMRQNETEGLLVFEFDGEKVSRLYMTDPDIYAFDVYKVRFGDKMGVLDANGYPRMFKHSAQTNGDSNKMSSDELLAFGIEVLYILLREANINVSSTYRKPDIEYPNLVYEENGTRIHVRLLPFLPPAADAIVSNEELTGFVTFAHRENALAVIIPISFFCMDTMGETPVRGGTYAIKFNEETVC